MSSNGRIPGAAHKLKRRIFLKALALGATAPVAARLASEALAQSGDRPKRFMLFYVPHGVPPEHFNPVVQGGDPTSFSLSQSGVSILGPLEERFKGVVNVLQGFKYPTASTHEGILSFLSNLETFKNGAVDEVTPRTTVEHFIANGLGVKVLALGACAHRPWGLDKDGKLMWNGEAIVPEKNPLVAFEKISGNATTTPPAGSAPNAEQELTRALLDFTESEISALRTELSALTSEQTKLTTHLEAIAALKATAGSNGPGPMPVSCSTAPSLPALDALRTMAQGQSDEFFLREDSFPALLAAQLEVAAYALQCNAARVVAVQPMYANCDFDFKFMGSPGSHHNALSHTGPQGTLANPDLKAREPFAKAQRWFIQQLVDHTLSYLDVPDPADPGHKVIDNTIVLLCSEIGEGAWHTSATTELKLSGDPGMMSYVPLVTIGGGGGALKTGQVITYPTDRPCADLFLALSKAMGLSVTSFGGSTTPVQEILA